MDTQEILDLLSTAREGFQIALSEIAANDKKKDLELAEKSDVLEKLYNQLREKVKKYGK